MPALPLEEAILHATRESTWAAWLDHVTGVLKSGFAVDIVVLDRDFFAQGPASLLKTNVQLTMMNGEIVYSV